MEELQAGPQSSRTKGEGELYFWALGDLHYFAHAAWQTLHAPQDPEPAARRRRTRQEATTN